MNALEEVRRIYQELPEVDCKGLCWNACGPIDMSDAEREQIRTKYDVEIEPFTQERSQRWAAGERLYCTALSFGARDGQMGCAIYEDRPAICRLWGAGEGEMACPHGCDVSSRLTNEQIMQIVVRVMAAGGAPGLRDGAVDEMSEILKDPELSGLFSRYLNGDRSAERRLQEALTKRRT